MGEDNKKLVATELELLLVEMTNDFNTWRNSCGRSGWHEMESEYSKKFFQKYIIEAAKIGKKL